jgi:hypothetical protein
MKNETNLARIVDTEDGHLITCALAPDTNLDLLNKLEALCTANNISGATQIAKGINRAADEAAAAEIDNTRRAESASAKIRSAFAPLQSAPRDVVVAARAYAARIYASARGVDEASGIRAIKRALSGMTFGKSDSPEAQRKREERATRRDAIAALAETVTRAEADDKYIALGNTPEGLQYKAIRAYHESTAVKERRAETREKNRVAREKQASVLPLDLWDTLNDNDKKDVAFIITSVAQNIPIMYYGGRFLHYESGAKRPIFEILELISSDKISGENALAAVEDFIRAETVTRNRHAQQSAGPDFSADTMQAVDNFIASETRKRKA